MIKPNNTKNCYFKMKKPEFLAKTFIPTVLTIFQSQVLAYRMIVFTTLKYGPFYMAHFIWAISYGR